MLAREVADLLRTYLDEPDQTVVDDTYLASILERAYDDFRQIVVEIDPYVYATRVTQTLSNVKEHSLNGVILGASPLYPKMYQLVDIFEVSPSDATDVRYRFVPSLEANPRAMAEYSLVGTELVFFLKQTGTIRIDYIPVQRINWTTSIGAGLDVAIDDLDAFHDLIALIAYLQYAILDAADNPQLLRLMQRRQQQLKDYLSNRSGGIVETVATSDWW